MSKNYYILVTAICLYGIIFPTVILESKDLTILKEVQSDVTGDKKKEKLVVYDTGVEGDFGTERELHIFKSIGKSWKLWKKLKGPILSSNSGGMLGDSFQNLEVTNKRVIIISHFGGSREKWNYTHKYRYQKGKFYLIGATSENGVPCESSEIFDYNLLSGKAEISDKKETCDNNGDLKGEPKVIKKLVTVGKKKIIMDDFEPGSNKIQLKSKKVYYY